MKARGSILLLLFSFVLSASTAGNRNTYPLPEDRGTAGTLAALQKLPVYARVLETTAHPDDESAGTLTWLSRKFHAQTALFCLTRGEGGQNILGNEKYSELGLVRTGELLEASRYYGTDLFFGNAVDFGFSKTADETLAKWGHDATLSDMVRFIRRWRPTVILSRFQGSSADGHGHHQAAGILTREAFRAAADPASFPEQFSSGLTPWRAKKLYVSGAMAPIQGSPASDMPARTLRVPVGDYDPVLGRSCREIAAEGYSKHRTQGNGAAFALPGQVYEYFRLEEPASGVKANEEDFFASVDTSLLAILELAGSEKPTVAFLEQDLSAAQQTALKALQVFEALSPETCAAAVSEGIGILGEAIRKTRAAAVSPAAKSALVDALQTKLEDFRTALNSVLGIYFIARMEDATGIPGEKLPVTTHFYNRGSEIIVLKNITLEAPGTVAAANADNKFGELKPGGAATYRYSVDLAPDAKATEPFWHLDAAHGARYTLSPTADPFAPFGKPEITAEAVYAYRNIEVPIHAAARAQGGGPLRGSDFVDFQIVPLISVTMEPDFRIAPMDSNSGRCVFRVTVLNNKKGETRGNLKLASRFPVEPAAADFKLLRKGETYTASFTVRLPAAVKAGSYPVKAIASAEGKEFSRGYHVISYPENWTRNFYFPAQSRIERFRIRTPPNLTVGYVPGAGDEIPEALEQIGIKVRTLSGSDLAFGEFDRFGAIITGIRAYNVNGDLQANNRRLLDYVSRGGTLIVQYVRPSGRPGPGPAGSSFNFGPYPMIVSDSDRITVEDSPIRILDPANPLFHWPNRVTESDFDGWVQERGLYFMSSWDSRYKALLSGNDPGEDPKNGGMLYARYGKGHYIYTGYAWFRQLPAGVPGAFRIFANMLGLGRIPASKKE